MKQASQNELRAKYCDTGKLCPVCCKAESSPRWKARLGYEKCPKGIPVRIGAAPNVKLPITICALKAIAERSAGTQRAIEFAAEVARLERWLDGNSQRSPCWKRRQVLRVAQWYKDVIESASGGSE